MEAVRCEGGPATFSPPLFSRLLRALATEPGVKPEVFTLLFTRYFSFADVRYYALLAIKSLASEAASSKATSATPAAAAVTGRQKQVKRTMEPVALSEPSSVQQQQAGVVTQVAGAAGSTAVAGAGASAAAGSGATAAAGMGPDAEGRCSPKSSSATAPPVNGHPSLHSTDKQAGNASSDMDGQAPSQVAATTHDASAGPRLASAVRPTSPDALFRNLWDMLCALPERIDRVASDADAGGAKAQVAADAEDEAAEGTQRDAGGLKSWCGLAESASGNLTAAPDANESARQRRKRKAAEAALVDTKTGAKVVKPRATWANAKSHKRAFTEAWLAVLSLPIPDDLLRKVLLRIHESVIPNMLNPNSLADFLTYALDQGGLTGILALNGIFLLVTQHRLEYPAFFQRLYNLLTVDAFAAKQRAQFFALVDIFLASPMVPAYTAAAFIKRFARLSLQAPPAGALLAVAFIHNLIRRHPACMTMLHRPSQPASTPGHADAGGEGDVRGLPPGSSMQPAAGKSDPQGPGCDVYLEGEEDPAKSRAVESSLWEVEALRTHFCPQVATLTAVLDKDLGDRVKTSEVDLGPLLSASYASLFSQEVERRINMVPVAFYNSPPSHLFSSSAVAEEWPGWL
ncbi:CBF/Mak21 family-domain-containing protein [Haematococcus lacustris]